jgi:hypothetical protein
MLFFAKFSVWLSLSGGQKKGATWSIGGVGVDVVVVQKV